MMQGRAVWLAHRTHIPKVGGSNPSPATKRKDYIMYDDILGKEEKQEEKKPKSKLGRRRPLLAPKASKPNKPKVGATGLGVPVKTTSNQCPECEEDFEECECEGEEFDENDKWDAGGAKSK